MPIKRIKAEFPLRGYPEAKEGDKRPIGATPVEKLQTIILQLIEIEKYQREYFKKEAQWTKIQCPNCGETIEVIQMIDEALPVLCPKCGKEIIIPINENAKFPKSSMTFDKENNDELVIKHNNKIVKCSHCSKQIEVN